MRLTGYPGKQGATQRFRLFQAGTEAEAARAFAVVQCSPLMSALTGWLRPGCHPGVGVSVRAGVVSALLSGHAGWRAQVLSRTSSL